MGVKLNLSHLEKNIEVVWKQGAENIWICEGGWTALWGIS